MAYIKIDNAKTYQPQDGDTLESIAQAQNSAGNPITSQDIAQYNWGTIDKDEIENFMRDEMATRMRTENNSFAFSNADQPYSEIKIPEKFQQSLIPLKQVHEIKLRKKSTPKQFLGCCSIPSVTFGFNSSFIRPNIAEQLTQLEDLVQQKKDAKILIFGHTDAVGDELYNKKLSERRAWSVYSFIINDPDAWETLYNHKDEDWGVSAVQEILADLGHNPGSIDGKVGPLTRKAMREFSNIPENSPIENNSSFRKSLFSAYMSSKHDIDLPKERFLGSGFTGCGEFNLVEESDNASEKNRRVTFYFFHKDRPPNLPCAFADIAPCKKQLLNESLRHKTGFRCSFYDSFAKRCPAERPDIFTTTEVVLIDQQNQPVAGAQVDALIDGQLFNATADTNGSAKFQHLKSAEVCEINYSRYPIGSWNPAEES